MTIALPQFSPRWPSRRPKIATTAKVRQLIARNAPVAFGVSGGIDGAAAVLWTVRHLDAVGHRGPRVLIHSDLGDVEWADSLKSCKRLADHTGLELVTVSPGRGGLMGRWERRWESSVRRYANLECVKLILPWSTADMRFCTSEMKTHVICRWLRQRFSGQGILSVTGIRRDESPRRSKTPIAKRNKALTGSRGTWGMDWHPIPKWTKPQCFEIHQEEELEPHEAYGLFGSSRVSCVFCILAKRADLVAASRVPANAAIYLRMVALEIKSAFPFRADEWLGDVAPELLDEDMRKGLARAKEIAAARSDIESLIPDDLLYTSGWPRAIPTRDAAWRIARVRVGVAELMGFTDVRYRTGPEVIDRYHELWEKNNPQAKRRRRAA